MIDEKKIADFFARDVVPVSPDEVLEPTRVVWKKCGTITTKIFPTKERAWDFAMHVENLIEVQNVKATVPEQEHARKIGNLQFSNRRIRRK